jgi:hypothetical protein
MANWKVYYKNYLFGFLLLILIERFYRERRGVLDETNSN